MWRKYFAFSSVVFLAIIASLQVSAAFDLGFFKSKRNYLLLVGSSTVSPFMSAISEEFARDQNLKNSSVQTPVVESVGSTGGFQMFCEGVGYEYPDFVNASRLMRENELENCYHNGVKEIVEIKIGYDGIVFGNLIGGKEIKLSKEQIYLALAEKIYDKKTKKLINNPYQNWSEIDPKLPNAKIVVYGPPLTSGTRDVFADLVMEEVCFMQKEIIANIPEREERRRQCHKIRTDGNFIESGENDNLIIQNLKNNPEAFGIFGFNFLVANKKTIQGVKIDNVAPSFETIASKKYQLSRPLFVYFKKEHLKLMPKMSDFIKEIISTETLGNKGYLLNSGLIALDDSDLAEIRETILSEIANDK